jgi:hypothetical protein
MLCSHTSTEEIKELLNFGDLKSVGVGQPLAVNISVNEVFAGERSGTEAVRPLRPTQLPKLHLNSLKSTENSNLFALR